MLTCKVGNTIINCFDGKYDKFTLKKWSEENRLVCPDCGKLYEYCHGQIVYPYFRHKEKNKECEGVYYEPETEEHIQGKLILYNWLLTLPNVKNVKLEAYIPETRQRPDLYFEADGKRYVIEFQCSPIASEYLERHELYQLAGINDIWILGIEKYRLIVAKYGFIDHSSYFKTIERYSKYYLNIKNGNLIFNKSLITPHIKYDYLSLKTYYSYDINNFHIATSDISINQDIIDTFIKKDKFNYEKRQIIQKNIKKCELFLEKIFLDFKENLYTVLERMPSLSCGFKCNKQYYQITNIENYPVIDFCKVIYLYDSPVTDLIFKIDIESDSSINKIVEYLKTDLKEFVDFNVEINKIKIRHEEERKNNLNKLKQELAKFNNEPLYLLFLEDNQIIDKNIRFKVIHDYRDDITELAKILLKELKFIKSKGAKEYILMIPKKKYRRSSSTFYPYYKVRNYKSDVKNDFSELGLNFLEYKDLRR